MSELLNKGDFKIASWQIEKVTKNGLQETTNLSINSIKNIIGNRYFNELESILKNSIRLQIQSAISKCIDDSIKTKELIFYYIDEFNFLTGITSSLNYSGELDDPDLFNPFVNQIKANIELLKIHINLRQQDDFPLILDAWAKIENNISSKDLSILITKIKRDFYTVNQNLKKCVNDLKAHEDKLFSLNNSMEK